MRYFLALLGCLAIVSGCETTPKHDTSNSQPPRVMFYNTKAARVATPAWAPHHTTQQRSVKLVYDDEARVYAVEGRERYYYDLAHDRFLRFWDNIWQTSPAFDDRTDWVVAPEDFVSEPLKKRYENAPPGNPPTQSRKKR